MKLRNSPFDGLMVVGIDGELDGSNVALLDECLSAHLAAGKRRIVIDLQACSFMDSKGLGALLYLRRDVPEEGALALAGPSPNLRRLFEIAGLTGQEGFEVYGDVAAACAAMALGEASTVCVENAGPEGQAA